MSVFGESMMNNTIYFSKTNEKYGCFSNFYPCFIWYHDLSFKNAEAAWQSRKTLDPDERKAFCNYTGKEAKSAGRKLKLRKDWDLVKVDLMLDICLEKFRQNPKLKELLLSTGDQILIEDTTGWHDNYWGDCQCSKCKNIQGQNMLGKTLMKVRDQLRDTKEEDDYERIEFISPNEIRHDETIRELLSYEWKNLIWAYESKRSKYSLEETRRICEYTAKYFDSVNNSSRLDLKDSDLYAIIVGFGEVCEDADFRKMIRTCIYRSAEKQTEEEKELLQRWITDMPTLCDNENLLEFLQLVFDTYHHFKKREDLAYISIAECNILSRIRTCDITLGKMFYSRGNTHFYEDLLESYKIKVLSEEGTPVTKTDYEKVFNSERGFLLSIIKDPILKMYVENASCFRDPYYEELVSLNQDMNELKQYMNKTIKMLNTLDIDYRVRTEVLAMNVLLYDLLYNISLEMYDYYDAPSMVVMNDYHVGTGAAPYISFKDFETFVNGFMNLIDILEDYSDAMLF